MIWDDIVTPINTGELEKLLKASKYCTKKTQHMLSGFREGFDMGYQGLTDRIDESANIPLRAGVGSMTEMWNKIMKEVKERHYAGPFAKPPMKYYVQSPIGLVPKAGNKTRLIFHLSFDFGKMKVPNL